MAFALVALVYRDPPGIAGASSGSFRVGLSRREWLLVLISGTIWGLFNVAYIVLISFAPDLFTARGYSLPEASAIVSVIGWTLIPLIPLTGMLVERVGWSGAFMTGGFLIAAAAASALPFTNAPTVALGFVALAIGVVGRPDHGAARAGAAAGIARGRHGHLLHLLLRRDGGAPRALRVWRAICREALRRPRCSPPP